jgi:APA family basic amino acid/polyamine antiporter
MENKLSKKYGLATAVAMVVGIVIGSGVFFKAEAVLTKTGGNMPLGIYAWLIVGAIMIACSYVFAVMAGKYSNVNGLVDYAEATVGKKYAYAIAWFSATIYTPAITSVLAWVSARYFCVIFGWDITGGSCLAIAGFFLCAVFVMNVLGPKIAGRFQVSTTVIKLIPLVLMAVIGTIHGFSSGTLAQNFATAANHSVSTSTGLLGSVVAVAYAYEGWILATSINAELKDAEKTLPRALIIGSLIVVATYILYYIGLSGAVSTAELMESGEAAARLAFQRLFGNGAGTLLFVLIVISCLGTLNGLTLANCRSFYAMAARNEGPHPDVYRQIDSSTNMPVNSSVLSLLMSSAWLLFFFGANLVETPWFGSYSFDSSELPIVTLYGMYIPILFCFMKNEKELGTFKRFVMPGIALAGCIFMVYAAFASHGVINVLHYLMIFAVIMIIGLCLKGHRSKA